jgi:GTP-dependent phosphoenolpyruvate carboxykinase
MKIYVPLALGPVNFGVKSIDTQLTVELYHVVEIKLLYIHCKQNTGLVGHVGQLINSLSIVANHNRSQDVVIKCPPLLSIKAIGHQGEQAFTPSR